MDTSVHSTGKRPANAKTTASSSPLSRCDAQLPSRRLSSSSRRQSTEYRRLSSSSRRQSTEYRRLSRSRVSFDDGRNRDGHKRPDEERSEEKQAPLPNTYQLEPECQFPVGKATAIIKDKMHRTLEGVDYDAATCSGLCTSLADELKSEIRQQLQLPRYKIVSACCIGGMNCTGLLVASRCAWDKERDNYASYTFQNKTLFATATVYAVYFD